MKEQDLQQASFLQVGGLEQSVSEVIPMIPSIEIRREQLSMKAK